jgi:hypothetical protein
MSLPKTLLVMALLVVAVQTAQASAAEPWTAPTPIPGSTDTFPDLTFAPGSGAGLAGWSGNSALPRPGDVSGAPVTAEGAAGPARKLTTGFLATRFRAYGSDGLIAVGARYVGVPRPLWAVGSTSGTLGTPRPLAGSRRGYADDLAVTADGRAVAGLRLCESARRCRRPVPAIVLRRRDGRFGKPIVLGPGPVSTIAVDISPDGDALAVWDRPLKGSTGRRGIHAAIRKVGGRTRTQRIGSSHPIPRISASLGNNGSALVGWLGQRINEGTPHSDAEVWIADAVRSRFGAPQRVEVVPRQQTGRYVGQAGVRVARTADGRKLAAWTGYQDGKFVVRAAPVEGGEVREPAQVLSDPAADTVLADLATGAAGEAVVMGLGGIRGSDPSGPVGVVAFPRAPGATAFGALEQVAEPKDFREAVRAEIVPTTGRVVAVWRDLGTQSLQIASRPTLAPGAYALPG